MHNEEKETKEIELVGCVPTAASTISVISSPVCRICHSSTGPSGRVECLLSPCLCRGTCAYVHRTCLEHWFNVIQNGLSWRRMPRCEICLQPYRTQCMPQYRNVFLSIWQWLIAPSVLTMLIRYIFKLIFIATLSSALIVLFLTPEMEIIKDTSGKMIESYSPTRGGIILVIVILLAFIVYLVVVIRSLYTHWVHWSYSRVMHVLITSCDAQTMTPGRLQIRSVNQTEEQVVQVVEPRRHLEEPRRPIEELEEVKDTPDEERNLTKNKL